MAQELKMLPNNNEKVLHQIRTHSGKRAHHILRHVSVPPGLEELLKDLTKAVLKQQPKDIHAFAAEHFEKALRKREELGKFAHRFNKIYAKEVEVARICLFRFGFLHT